MELVWEGEGLDMVGKEKATGKVRVCVDSRYFRPTEVCGYGCGWVAGCVVCVYVYVSARYQQYTCIKRYQQYTCMNMLNPIASRKMQEDGSICTLATSHPSICTLATSVPIAPPHCYGPLNRFLCPNPQTLNPKPQPRTPTHPLNPHPLSPPPSLHTQG